MNCSCSNSVNQQLIIQVYPLPTATFCCSDKELCIDDSTVLCINIDGTSPVKLAVLNHGTNKADTIITQAGTYTYHATGNMAPLLPSPGESMSTFYSIIWVEDQHCINYPNNMTSEATVKVNFTDDCYTCFYVLPNTFTPNNDNVNDKFTGEYFGKPESGGIFKFDLKIFDRWGETVFETADPNFTWDGKYHSQPLDMQMFIYSVNFICMNHVKINKSGTVFLIR
jgi:gliding motility-associated-like protein